MSQISNDEFATIIVTMSTIADTKEFFVCSRCLVTGTSEEMIEKKRVIRSCHGMSDDPIMKYSLDEMEVSTFTCPGNIFSAEIANMVPAFKAFKRGVMPYAGPYTQQPAKVMDVFGIMEQWYTDREMKTARDQQAKQRGAKGFGR